MRDHTEYIALSDDGVTGEITNLRFSGRTLHRVLSDAEEDDRPNVARDALEIGGEVLARTSHRGDLDQVAEAVDRLGEEGKRIIENTVSTADRVVEDTVAKLADVLGQKDGPLADVLGQFDPAVDGNLLDRFRDLIAGGIAKATKAAVVDLTEATKEQVDSLTTSLAILEKVAAIEEARLAEAKKGTAKGFDHERDVESLLGQLVAVTGDGLDDVSLVTGILGTKKGDKVITPKGGATIVTEEKCTKPVTEAKARQLLAEAMANRGAAVGMLIVDDETKVPGNQPYHLIDHDKVVVAADPTTLRLVCCLMRARAIEAAQAARALEDGAAVEALTEIRAHVDGICRALDRFKLVRTEHTKATKAIQQAAGYVDELARSLADDVADITTLIDAAVVDEDDPEKAAA
jgi:hypothetical protein